MAGGEDGKRLEAPGYLYLLAVLIDTDSEDKAVIKARKIDGERERERERRVIAKQKLESGRKTGELSEKRQLAIGGLNVECKTYFPAPTGQ